MASLTVHALVSFIFHILLIFYGNFHDTELADDGPLYTDVDYRVVTDAASHILRNESPYRRATYRYTPLLAYLLTPNIFFNPHWGKVIFSICNVLVGVYIGWILPKSQQSYALCWFYNPMSAIIATRGSYESIVAVLVLALVYAAKYGQQRASNIGVRSIMSNNHDHCLFRLCF
jgi:GPI mannosyltransferase 1 subunit M